MSKKKKKSVDLFARTISILSFVLAGLAVGIPYYQNEKILEESININLTEICSNNSEKRLIGSFGDTFSAIQIPYNLTISNNGNRTSSIIDFETLAENSNGNLFSFSEIEGDIIDKNGNKISLPININSGESKSFIYYIGAFIETDIYKVIDSISVDKRN